MLNVQVFSDLHLEKRDTIPEIKPECDILFLVGDIGNIEDSKYHDFIKYCSENWKLVISVLGNNEYYSDKNSIDELLYKYQCLHGKYGNVFLLERRSIELGGVKIIGATAWGEFYEGCIGGSPYKIKHRKCNGHLEEIGCDRLCLMHNESKKWILEQIDPTKDNIVVTHFPLTLENEYVRQEKHRDEAREILKEFGCDLDLKGRHLCCISGHTHHSHDFIKNRVRYISNQLGNEDEADKTSFNKSGKYIILQQCNI